MGRKTPPHEAYPKWTEARFWSFVRSNLRRAWLKWPPRFEALNEAKRIVSGKRHKYEYKCSKCKKWWKQKDVEVDHIVSCGTLRAYTDLPDFVKKLLVAKEGLQIVCKTCHRKKTNETKESIQES